jgi:acetyl-CoA C-acetyltransferase
VDRVFIAGAVRTPIGKRGGALAEVESPLLLGSIMAEAVRRAGVEPGAVNQVLAGCVTQIGDQAYNVARIAWLTGGLPETVPGTTLDAQCGSSHQAVNLGAAVIGSGGGDLVVAGGVEVMSSHALGANVTVGVG